MKKQGIFKNDANIMKTKDVNEDSVKELLKERDRDNDTDLEM